MKAARTAKDVILRGAAVIAGLQVFEQLSGLLSQSLIAAYFGTSATTDAYLVAVGVISLLSLWTTLPISQVVIPIFRYDLARLGERTAWNRVSVLLNTLTVVFFALTAAAWFLAPALARLVGLGMDDATAELAASLTRVLLIGIVLMGGATFLTQLHHSYGRFFAPGLAGIVANLATAGAIVLLASGFGVWGLAVGVVLGNLAQVLVQLPILWEHRRDYRARIDLRDESVKETWRLGLPVVVSTGGFQIDRVTDRFFAALLPAGSLAALVFARLLMTFPEKLLFKPFQRATFPHFTKLIAEEKTPALSRQLFQYVRLLVFLSVPAAAGIILLGDAIVSVVYARGAFDERSVELTRTALTFYAVGLPAAFVGHALNNTLIGLKNTSLVMRLSLFRIGTKIVLAFALLPFLSHGGIALAESLSHGIRSVILFVMLPAEIKGDEIGRTLTSLFGTLGATGVMVVTVHAMRTASDGLMQGIPALLCLVPLGAGVYFVASWLSRQDEIGWIGRNLATMARRSP